jgi:hypothetical protein
MRTRYRDFKELRPTGEASYIPDTRLDDGCEGAPRRQRVATTDAEPFCIDVTEVSLVTRAVLTSGERHTRLRI